MKIVKKKIIVFPDRPDPFPDKTFYPHHHYNNPKRIIKKDCDVFLQDEQNHQPRLLFSYRKNVLSNLDTLSLFQEHLVHPLLTSNMRGAASADTTKRVNSGILGYYDRWTPQMKKELSGNPLPYGRPTMFTERYPERFKAVLPVFQKLSDWYKQTLPTQYKIQKKVMDSVPKEFRIPKTVFTTITVNRDWQTAAHRDKGDLEEGMSCLAVVGENFRGGELGFPEYKILVEMEPGDAILMNSHELHGNTEMFPQDPSKPMSRFSMVCYIRTGLVVLDHNLKK